MMTVVGVDTCSLRVLHGVCSGVHTANVLWMQTATSVFIFFLRSYDKGFISAVYKLNNSKMLWLMGLVATPCYIHRHLQSSFLQIEKQAAWTMEELLLPNLCPISFSHKYSIFKELVRFLQLDHLLPLKYFTMLSFVSVFWKTKGFCCINSRGECNSYSCS